jgi:type IV secretory pathway TraG/TraD family ATPase VirD4
MNLQEINTSISQWIYTLAVFTNQTIPLVLLSLTTVLGLIGFTHADNNRSQHLRDFRNIVYRIIMLALLWPGVLAFFYFTGKENIDVLDGIILYYKSLAKHNWWILPSIVLIGLSRYYCLRHLAPWFSNWRKGRVVTQSNDSLSDIRKELGTVVAKDFDPTRYYKKDHIFLGLDALNKPIYITLAAFCENHAQIIGATGTGKGVIIGVVIDQLIKYGYTVFYFDPKHDKNIPRIMEQRCRETGRQFTYLSLFDNEPGNWGPFLGGSLDSARTRLEVAFGLNVSGTDADFHKSRERKMALDAFNKSRDIDGLFNFCEMSDHESRVTTELGIWKKYRSLAIKSGGFSIADAITKGAVVYVKGNLYDKVMLNCFKAMMLESSQEIQRLADYEKKQVFMLWDEVSFYVAPEFPRSLATIRSFGMTFSLAYQSQNDLKALEDRTVNAQYVYSGVNTNCQIKLVYGGFDDANAKWVSEIAGTVQKHIATRTDVQQNAAAAELWADRSTVTLQHEPLFHPNKVKALPKRVCIFIAPEKEPKLCFTSWVRVKDPNALPRFLLKLNIPENAEPEVTNTPINNPDDCSRLKPNAPEFTDANPFYRRPEMDDEDDK